MASVSPLSSLNNDRGRLLGFWDRFWFKPADPTTLGFMRILVGMLVVYTHIVYSYDLYELFGKDGWYNLDSMNKRRHEQPYVNPPNDFPPEDQIEETRKPYEYAPANTYLYAMPPDEALRQLELVIPVLPWDSPQERAMVEGMTSDDDKLPHLSFKYYKFVDEYNFDPRGLLDKDGVLLPERERKEIMESAKMHGVDPRKADGKGVAIFSIWFHVIDPDWMVLVHVAIIVVMILFTLGIATPITGILTWLGAVSYIHRAPTALFGQDTMMNILLIYLVIGNLIPGPGGAALSVDRLIARWRARRLGQEFPASLQPTVLANAAYRLVQIHLCLIYAFAGTSKLQGTTWWNGTAVWWTMANTEFAPLNRQIYRNYLEFLCKHRFLWELVMDGGNVHTLFVELCFPFLVWNRRTRWIMLMAATFLHAGIALFMGLTIFQIFMLIFLLTFYPSEIMHKLIDAIRDTFRAILPARAHASHTPAPVATGA
jgi:hypothetical protein